MTNSLSKVIFVIKFSWTSDQFVEKCPLAMLRNPSKISYIRIRKPTWAPAGMSKGHSPLWKCCKVFCALVVTVKRLVNKIYMHHFHDLSSAFGGFVPGVPDPYRGSIPGPRWGTFVPKPLIYPPLETKSPGCPWKRMTSKIWQILCAQIYLW